MPSSKRTAIVVCAHRAYPTLEKCLRGFRSMTGRPGDLLFVDNGSPETLAESLFEKFPDISFLRLERNRQFCGGYNAGLRLAMDRGYDFALIVNADTEVVNVGFIEALLEAAVRHPRAAFLGPLVYYRAVDQVQNTCLKFPGILRNALVWLPWRFLPSLFEKQAFQEQEVEFLNGVCVLCRVHALREIGLMDEIYGGYQEDSDWSWRAKRMGWSSVFCPIPSIIHHEEDCGYEFFSLKSFLLKRNTVFWFLKVGKRTSAVLYAFASMTLARLRALSARNPLEREKHRYFLDKLSRSYRGLLHGEDLDSWFGPPLGSWDWSK